MDKLSNDFQRQHFGSGSGSANIGPLVCAPMAVWWLIDRTLCNILPWANICNGILVVVKISKRRVSSGVQSKRSSRSADLK